jgi:hypothetical protein
LRKLDQHGIEREEQSEDQTSTGTAQPLRELVAHWYLQHAEQQ